MTPNNSQPLGPRIVLIGAALTGNQGARLMVESAIHLSRQHYSHYQFSLLSHYPSEDTRNPRAAQLGIQILDGRPMVVFPVLLVHALIYRFIPWQYVRQKLRLEIRVIAMANEILDVSGISFAADRKKALIYNVAVLMPALILKKQITKLPQAMGPFTSTLSRTCARVLLPKLHHIYARGEVTFEHLTHLKLKLNNVSMAEDLGLIACEIFPYPAVPDRGRHILLIPSVVVEAKHDAIFGKGHYLGLMSDLVKLLSSQYFVKISAFASRPLEPSSHNSDAALCQNVAKRAGLKPEDLNVEGELETLCREISQADLIITGRFHGMITALSYRKRVLVTSWGHKYHEAARYLGGDVRALHFGDLELSKIQEEVAKAISEEPPTAGYDKPTTRSMLEKLSASWTKP